ERLRRIGERLAQRLVARYRRAGGAPELWFTYHLYHKGPDWLGPTVCRALGIPYVVAEASIAAKQRDGPWAAGYAGSVAAIVAADATVCLNPVDAPAVRQMRGAARLEDRLAPFLDVVAFTGAAAQCMAVVPRRSRRPRLVTVAMMRDGAKLASYRLLAAALARVTTLDWELVVVGDGPARGEVEAAFARFDPSRIRFVGGRPSAEIAALLSGSDLFVWPAIDEAFGMAFLEAQACGLPVIGGNGGGVAAVVADGETGVLVPTGNVDAFALATRRLLVDAEERRRMGREAGRYVRTHHDLAAAATQLGALLRRVVAQRAATSAPLHPAPAPR
ncbi:MAG: glycosyltransferase family 4 protein, partial [Betaproteobacteria bacterium]